MKPKYKITILFLVLVIFVFGLSKMDGSHAVKTLKTLDGGELDQIATKIVADCSDKSYRPTCYEKEVPKLMDTVPISMEQAFDVVRRIQDKDKTYAYCHVLGHELAAKETAKDPSKWKDVVARSPGGLCSNGGVHGAFQERFRTETLTDAEIEKLRPDLLDVCESRVGWTPTQLQQATCYHALGHLLMYVSNADLHKSVELCGDIASKSKTGDYSKICYDGVFMQIFQPLEPEDFALIKGKVPAKKDMKTFCSSFPKEAIGPCWDESWPLSHNEIMTPKGVVQFCTLYLKDSHDVDRCFLSMFYIVTAETQFNLPKLKTYCGALPSPVDAQCFANVSSRLIETDYRNISASVNFCEGIAKKESQDACFQELLMYSTYNFLPQSPEFFKLCNAMPPNWKAQCLRKS